MTEQTDILIVGGGLNGPCLALALAQAGLRSTVIDARPREDFEDRNFDGRSYALSLGSKNLLKGIGIWPQVATQVQDIRDIVVSDGRPGEGAAPQYVHFDHREIEEGPFGAMLEDRYLRRALLEACDSHPMIDMQFAANVTGQSTDGGAAVTLADGRVLHARLLVGCDGRASGTASRAGIKRHGHDYGQTGLVCAIAHEKPHNGVAHQFFMPSGPLAILPLPGDRCSIVWTERTARAGLISALDDDGYLTELRPRFGDHLGEIKLEGARFSYPLKLTLAEKFVAPHLALVGDAAHGVHPIAGQGLNLGFRDVAALAEVLAEAKRRGENFAAPDVLARYAQWRRFDTGVMAIATDGINHLFSNDNPLLRGVRDAGLGLVNRLPFARRSFMREAAGLTGDLPRLMKGRPL